MTLQPATYEAALQKRLNSPAKPRKPMKAGKPLSRGRKPLSAKPKLKKKAKRTKLISMKGLKKKVWKEFSIYVRTSQADENGFVKCVTCDAPPQPWNSGGVHAGHWIHNRLDFDPRNVHPQCVLCNYHWNTKVNVRYAIFMARTYGVEVMDELRLLSNTASNKHSRAELEETLRKYQELNRENPLLKEK